jgi:hypothetical protein
MRWAVFTVLFSLLPFAIVWLGVWSDARPFDVMTLWPHGELLLVATAISADAVGDLVGSSPRAAKSKVVCAGACVILLFIAAVWYAMIQGHPTYPAQRIFNGSIALFGGTVLASFGCKALAEV